MYAGREARMNARRVLNEALANDPGDGSLLCRTIGEIAKSYGVQQVAEKAGVERTSFYRTFNGKTDARLSNVLRVLGALGFRITIR